MQSQVDLRSITTNKARRGDGIPVELFQILKDAAAKVLHSICQQTGKLRSGHNWKSSFFILIPKKGNAKQCSNYHTIALISHASKVMHKNSPSQASTVREPRCSSWIQKRHRNQRSNCQHLLDHRKSKIILRKTSISASLTTQKPLCGSQRNTENS